MEFDESSKDRDALIEAARQFTGSEANDAQQTLHTVCQRYFAIHSTTLECSLSLKYLSLLLLQ